MEWVPALISSGLVTALGVAGGLMLKASVERGVQHALDRETEKLRAALRTHEEEFRGLRAGALSAAATRQAENDRRKTKAVESLWSVALSQRQYSFAVAVAQILDLEETDKALANGGADANALKQFADTLLAGVNLEPPEPARMAEVERLFVAPETWKAIEALRLTATRATLNLMSIKLGVGQKMMKNISELNVLIKDVLPSHADFIDRYPATAPYFLYKHVEDEAFRHLKAELNASSSDLEAVDRAAAILRHARGTDQLQALNGLPAKFKADPPDVTFAER